MLQTRPQPRRFAPALLLLALVLLGMSAAPAFANVFLCQRYRAELAGLNDGASTQRALQSEIARLQAYYRTLNCDGARFALFEARPPQCGAVEQRIRALNAGYGAENGEVVAARRRQLIAAIGNACTAARPGFETPYEGERTARGGAQVICVKTCDGSYFPMSNLPDGQSGADEMCRALCPGTEAVAYSMPFGDDSLKYAATVRGTRAYSALPTAFKFRTSFDPSCSCKRPGQTWAQTLARAESLLFRHKGDIFVTPMQAERLSRPRVRLVLVGRADRTAAELAADAASRSGAAASTDGAATALVAEANAVPQERSAIRVIAPDQVPVPIRSDGR